MLSNSEIKKRVSDIAHKYGVEKAYLFGSYARGEANQNSDVDICIIKGKMRTLVDLSGFYLDLEEALGIKVDVVTTDSISGEFKHAIEKEFVEIYGND
ncbi:nucleotidyltransferase domain-containing protein [Treponema sp. TIM-1]|uniref:nucleotidyltransferase family protein n=1 Tax=Treponema sp. TIM-1 TaxID=2898417 RepID=UPI00397FCEFE